LNDIQIKTKKDAASPEQQDWLQYQHRRSARDFRPMMAHSPYQVQRPVSGEQRLSGASCIQTKLLFLPVHFADKDRAT
jgi:hypothetical protein